MKLTEFQTDCEQSLIKLLTELRRKADERRIEGKKELFIYGKISGTPYQFYIYEDGAEIGGGGLDLRYEAPGFDTLDDLKDAFLEGIRQHVSVNKS